MDRDDATVCVIKRDVIDTAAHICTVFLEGNIKTVHSGYLGTWVRETLIFHFPIKSETVYLTTYMYCLFSVTILGFRHHEGRAQAPEF